VSAPTSIDSTNPDAPDAAGRSKRYVRLALLALFAWMAWHAFHDEYGYVPIVGDVDLAIHECGHILFMPFGRTMTILGGSLTQVVFPLIFAGYFLVARVSRRRDVYAAMLCTCWSALNLLSVAIYCADSRAGQLMLLDGSTGQDSDSHDWKNLLTIWHRLDRDTAIARRMRSVAVMMCVGALCVAAWSAMQEPVEGVESA
jgi:hypothetical protein